MTVYLKKSSIKLLIKHTDITLNELLIKVKKYYGLASWMSSSVMTIELSSCEYQQGKTTLFLPNSAAKSAHTTLRTW
jgi:hypothetical protein